MPPNRASVTQERIWTSDLTGYQHARSIHIQGTLSIAALRQALGILTTRHEILRTTYRLSGGVLTQIISPPVALELPVVDLESLPREDRLAAAERDLREAASQPFDLERDPVLRTKIYRLSAKEHLLMIVIHQIAADRASMRILVEQIAEHYERCLHEGPPAVDPPSIQYADYAICQRSEAHGEWFDTQLAFWKNLLAKRPPALQLPISRPRPPGDSGKGAVHRFSIPAPLTAAALALSLKEDCPLFAVLLAVFQVLLHRYSGEDDLVLGIPVSGRNRLDLQGVVGSFNNILPLRTDLSGDPTFVSLLERVREVWRNALAHQEVPLGKLLEELDLSHDSSHPLFSTTFEVREVEPPPVISVAGARMRVSEIHTGTATCDLRLAIAEAENGWYGTVEYRTDLFDLEMIERLGGHYTVLLKSLTEEPGRRISEAPILTEQERRQILVEWNATSRALPPVCVHQLVSGHAARRPEAVAVIDGERRLTYGELDRLSNRLARHLQSLGVGTETLVGLCLERSLEIVVGLLGILKAGGAYVPLDPQDPPQRLQMMIEDAGL
ncbi:MAG TPA: condensation domain-containing protein, partial [Bryobacteraceae bacterium]